MHQNKLPARRKQLFYPGQLVPGQTLPLPRPLARRLHRVLRLKAGTELAFFNGQDGLVAATLVNPVDGVVELGEQLRPQPVATELWLLLALAKKDAFDRAVRMATECGIDHIQPVQTAFCVPDRLNPERLETIIIEAAEQCERLTLPQLHAPLPLAEAVAQVPGHTWWGDEAQVRLADAGHWGNQTTKPPTGRAIGAGDGLLIGPEGGFAPAEASLLKSLDTVTAVGLGPHILRVDTAVAVGCGLLLAGLASTGSEDL